MKDKDIYLKLILMICKREIIVLNIFFEKRDNFFYIG